MRKFYLFFALLIGISSAAWADISGEWTSTPVSPWTTTAASNVPDGVTAVDDVSATHSICVAQRQVKVSTTGDVVASFTWSDGNHSLIVFGVDLVDTNGDVAKADYRKQQTGGNRNTISYTLNAVDAGNYTLRFWVLYEAKDNDLTKTIGSYSVTGADEAYFDATNASCVVIKNKGNNKYATYTAANVLSENIILTAAADLSINALFEIAAINGDGATNGYTIKVKNAENTYVYAIGTGSNDNNVGIKTVETIDDACKWTIKSNDAGAWYITPFGSSNGWNVRGSNTVDDVTYNGIGQWNYNYAESNRWYIMTPAEMLPANCTYSAKVGFPAEDTYYTALNTAHSAAITLASTFSEDNYNAFITAQTAIPSSPTLTTPTSGLYRVKNAAGVYLYQDEDATKDFTLANAGEDNPKYYYQVTFGTNTATLKNSLGQYPTRGSSATYNSANSLTFGNNGIISIGTQCNGGWKEGYFVFPYEGITTATVSSAAYVSASNPYFVHQNLNNTTTTNQYTFEAVELGSNTVYTVELDRTNYDCDVNVTLNSDSYIGNKTVHDGGFYVLSAAPSASDFTADDANGNKYYNAVVTIDGTTIKVAYEVNNVEFAKDYVAASEANKVGYPTSTSTVAKELKSALETYQASETSENLSALSTKLTAYSSATSDISMPVDGKAYTFKNVAYDSGNRWYLKYVNETTGITLTSNAEEATTFVCRKVGEGQYAFVNNDGKYLAWKGGDGTGVNDNKGYVNAYDEEKAHKNETTYTDWAQLTIEKMLASATNVDGEQADLCGYMLIKGRRYNMNESDYFVITAAGSFNHASAPFFKNNNGTRYSSAFLIEDAAYANVVSLKDAESLESGKNIATFSAPFPTVVPENTTAYSVETQNAHNVTAVSTYKVAEAGQAIPANTGVILMGTETQVTMLPRTTETTVVIAEGALGNSAGAAKDITTENSYVLSNQSSLWAFYKVGAGATALPMNKAYLVLPESSESVIRFNLVSTTGLDLVGADNAATQGKVYDLSGREVKAAAKGLYIVGGKKVIVK